MSNSLTRTNTGLRRASERTSQAMRAKTNATVPALIAELRLRLDKAAELGQAAEACATAGSQQAAIDVTMDVEQLVCEATTPLNAACLINRMHKDQAQEWDRKVGGCGAHIQPVATSQSFLELLRGLPMHRSSETIGKIAAALALAQRQLQNPEKSQSAALPASAPQEQSRTFRYASLASGLDIIRKALGEHEIATVQSTSLDRELGRFASTRFWLIHPANGLLPIGLCAPQTTSTLRTGSARH